MTRIPLAIWIAGLAGWMVLSLVIAIQIDVGGLYGGTGVRIGPATVWVFVSNLFWPAMLPLVVRLADRWPNGR